jgi:hypothetical protein
MQPFSWIPEAEIIYILYNLTSFSTVVGKMFFAEQGLHKEFLAESGNILQ